MLIWDIDLKLTDDPPWNWRTTDDPLTPGKSEAAGPILGLRDLRASGSGEFTPEGLKLVLARTRGPVTAFDLRQETRIFVKNTACQLVCVTRLGKRRSKSERH